jgi:hypothetical protein
MVGMRKVSQEDLDALNFLVQDGLIEVVSIDEFGEPAIVSHHGSPPSMMPGPERVPGSGAAPRCPSPSGVRSVAARAARLRRSPRSSRSRCRQGRRRRAQRSLDDTGYGLCVLTLKRYNQGEKSFRPPHLESHEVRCTRRSSRLGGKRLFAHQKRLFAHRPVGQTLRIKGFSGIF